MRRHRRTPYDRGTFSSRVTFYTGMAVKKAAEDAKQQLFEMASRMLEIPASDLAVENERDCVGDDGRELSFSLRQVLERAHNREKPILGRGWYGGKGDYPSLPHKAQGKEYVPGWKYAAQAVEVEIDEETGMVKVRKDRLGPRCWYDLESDNGARPNRRRRGDGDRLRAARKAAV